MCYTSDLQTSPIFTVDYYKGVAKSAAEAGAHMIGIKVEYQNEPRRKYSICGGQTAWAVDAFSCLLELSQPAAIAAITFCARSETGKSARIPM